MRGRKPKPSAQKAREGNPGRRPMNETEPHPTVEGLKCPTWLSPKAKKEWKRLVPELIRLGLATMADEMPLAAYCQAVAELEDATETLDREGRIFTEPVVAYDKTERKMIHVGERKKEHPAVKLQRDAFGRIKQFMCEFGLTPSSRSRLHSPAQAGEADPLAELILHAHDAG